MGLFKKKWEHNDPQKRIAGIAKLNDQSILEHIAAQDSSLEVRLAAIDKIMNDLFLAQLCNAFGGNSPITRAALPKIRDREILLSLAVAAKDGDLARRVMGAAPLKDLRDDAVLKAVVASANTMDAKCGALSLMRDQQYLFQVAMTMSAERLALAAAAALSDPALIRRVALEAGAAGVRRAAVLRVEDQAVLGKAALGDPETAVRKAAVPRLKDKAVLRQLILGDEPRELYNAAVDNYMATEDGADHDDVLLKIAMSDTYSQAATLRLRDQAALQRVYRESGWWDAREAALRQIDDQELMRKTVTEEPFRSRLFEIAYSKLPFGNARVMELLESLEIKNWSDRKAAAEKLQEVLGKDEAASELLWGRVATLANAPHSDASPHTDGSYSSGGSGDCTHSDYHRHTDTGIGIAFPAHPGM